MANNYLNYIQILTDNYLLESGATIRGGSSVFDPKPISYKFGGDQEVPENPNSATSFSSVNMSALNPDSTFYQGVGWPIDIDLGAEQRTTNCILQFQLGDIVGTRTYVPFPDITWRAILECNATTAFPNNYDSQSGYTPNDIFFGRRVSQGMYYFSLPRNLSYQYYRLKVYNPASGFQGGNFNVRDIFLGDSVDIDRAPAKGLIHQSTDLSQIFVAESGREYCLEKPILQNITTIDLPFLKRYQVSSIKIWSDQMGISTPFWTILDPQGVWDGPVFGATFGVYRLATMPTFTHQFADVWSTNLSLKEVI